MAAPQVRQSTAFYAPSTATAMGTATLGAWPNATLAGSRIVVFFGVTSSGDTGITATASVGGTAMTATGVAIRTSAGADAENIYAFQLKNAAAAAASPHVVTAGGAASHYQWGVALEVTGDDNTRNYDIPPFIATGVGASFTIGPSGVPDQGDILWLGGVSIPNIQSMTVSGGFSQITQGGSGGAGGSTKTTGLVAKQSQSVAASVSLSVAISAGNTRQYAGILLAIPATTTGGGGGGGGGYGGSPQSFPLGPPDMTGATTLTDPNPAAHWAPSLTNGVDYVLNMPNQRSAGITVTGGGNIYVPKWLVKLQSQVSPLFSFGGGSPGRIIHVEQFHIDPNGFKCDAFKSQNPASGTILQLKVGRTEKLIGDTSLHSDMFQASGGVGDTWIEDFTAGTNYNGLNLQQEGKLVAGYTPINISTITLSAGVITVTTASAHNLTVGKFFQINDNINNNQPFSGGFQVASVVNSTRVTATFGDGTPSNYTDSGSHTYSFQQFTFPYTCGSLHMNRVNLTGYPGANMALRFGARTAQNSGFNTGHPNDDQTPIDELGWAGTFDVPTDQTFWVQPPSGVALGSFMAPDSNSSTYSHVRPVSHAGTPAYVNWPNWPAVTSPTRAYLGAPATGDYVVISGGLPVPTVGGGGTTPAPVNTSPPVAQPNDPTPIGVVSVQSLGGWSNTDTTTNWTVTFQSNLGGTGGWVDVQTTANLTQAQAAAKTFSPPLSGYEYRLKVIADNGQSTTAFSAATNIVADTSSVTIVVDVE